MGINDNKNILGITPFLRLVIKDNPKVLKKGSMFLRYKNDSGILFIKGSGDNLYEIESEY